VSDEQNYTDLAVDAVLAAVEHEHDFGGWLASVLAMAAAELGSSYALIAGRPGSWGATLVSQLTQGTVGGCDDYLDHYRRRRPYRHDREDEPQ